MSLKKWVICTDNDGYPASLEHRKLYETIDDDGAPDGWIRVIDESGEDYLYPASRFMPMQIETPLEARLLSMA
ncbi:MAG: hypothetical protein LBE62_07600 [Azonexus sp.]|jgi:hypothetical protein|nr:hypothetical protein [Azonexus sp.]